MMIYLIIVPNATPFNFILKNKGENKVWICPQCGRLNHSCEIICICGCYGAVSTNRTTTDGTPLHD